ncbi:hypothetical protein EBR21_06965, partial [bacterium]|nr:hypothetical protein [bacterium]
MRKIVVGVFALAVILSCGKSKSKSSSSSDAKVNFQLAIVNEPSSSGSGLLPLVAKPVHSFLSQFQSVPASGKNLKSLKIHFDSIQICQEVVMNGTATGGSSGCKTIYQGPENRALSDTTNIKGALEAAAASDAGFIDVMNPESLKTLNQAISITPEDAGTYKYGLVSASGPIKVVATMVDPADGTTPVLYSKATRPGSCRVNNNPAYDCAVAASPMTTGPAEEAIFIGMGGGAMVLKFQQPFVITADDISNSQKYTLTLAFNPDSLVQGVTSGGATNFPPMSDNTVGDGYNLGNTMALVGAQMAGIFYKTNNGSIVGTVPTPTPTPAALSLSSTKPQPLNVTGTQDANVMRESYLGTYSLKDGSGSPSGSAQLRIEFYYISSDADKTIYGVSTAMIPTANTPTYLIGWQRVYGVTTNA